MLNIHNKKLMNGAYYLIAHHNFWAEMFLSCNIIKGQTKTVAVNVTEKGMNFYYNDEYISKLEQSEVNFAMIHEIYHLISNHMTRATNKGYDHKLANIAEDMIINSDIKERYAENKNITSRMIDGQEAWYFLPEEYTGKKIMEDVYEWLQKNRPDITDNLDSITEGNPVDEHMEDIVPSDVREGIVKDIEERLRQRGTLSSDMEALIGQLRPPTKNYLKMIKSSIEVMGSSNKQFTWQRVGRKYPYSKGFRKMKKAFNMVLDVSGSMHGSFEKALSCVFRGGYEVNLYQIDTEVKVCNKIKSKSQLQRLRIMGCGGTTLQPAIDRIIEDNNKLNTIILTDGYTDTLDVTHLAGKVLILSVDVKCPLYNDGNNKVKQIIIEK